MAIFKCKMCGGTIEFNPGDTVGVCDSCGSRQTLPRLDDEKKANLYDRANHFRRNNDYDKAMGIYEQILNEDSTDAEAYWSLVLCRYGIEYVEDPATHKRVPTVNRAQYTSVFSDEDYKSALQYADSYQRVIYEDEAKAIDDIQKGILEISQKEAPFDVFICYKETDNNGRRTMDSVLANDLYHQLTQEGFKVFFSRITLEDKLGTAYEPYIFAALNSAKVMVVLGTKPEYFNAVWVKNEWSRYLALVRKSGGKKVLIPAYKDMDPYDLPEEFSHLQAQDMSKLGFMQDLIRGIKKITAVNAPKQPVKETVVVQQGGVNTTVSAQVQRGSMALEDREWAKADSFFEEALNLDPHCAEAYIGKMLARDQMPSFDAWVETQKDKYAARPAEGETLIACPEDSEHIDKIAPQMVLPGFLEEKEIRNLYAYNRGYYSILSERRNQKEEQLRELSADRLLLRAKQYAEGDTRKRIETGLAAITESLDQRIEEAQNVDQQSIAIVTDAYKAHLEEADKKAADLYRDAWNRREEKYRSAVELMKNAEYWKAKYRFQDLTGYKDSAALAEQCEKLEEAAKAAEKEAAKNAIKRRNRSIAIVVLIFAAILAIFVVVRLQKTYNAAVTLMNEGKYGEAVAEFESINGYRDSAAQIDNCYIRKFGAEEWNKRKNLKVGDIYTFGTYEQDNDNSNGKEDIEWLVLARENNRALLISKYVLDYKKFNNTLTEVDWESCTLRIWLNEKFLNNAFSSIEQSMIIDSGNATADKVFLLSKSEVGDFFPSKKAQRCEPTPYAVFRGADKNEWGYTEWWLRSIADYGLCYYVHGSTGDVSDVGSMVDQSLGVRPAMWIDIRKIE